MDYIDITVLDDYINYDNNLEELNHSDIEELLSYEDICIIEAEYYISSEDFEFFLHNF